MSGAVAQHYLVDQQRLREILFNLLYNAVKFTPAGGSVTLTGEIASADKNNNDNNRKATVRFQIIDTGIGMSQDFVEHRLYHTFSQENENINSSYAGVGNSLAVTRELVTLMAGTIICDTREGYGTTFTITLPVVCAKNEKMRRKVSAKSTEYDLRGIRVLMCEDNAINQDIERRLLEHMHCDVEVADDGQIGLDKFRRSEEGYYDIVLMDIRMPNMDGLEAARQIRSLDRSDAAVVPILAVSANAFESDINASIEAG